MSLKTHVIVDAHSVDIHRGPNASDPLECIKADSVYVDIGQRIVPITELIAVYLFAKSI